MKLSQLFQEVPFRHEALPSDVEITGISSDSRTIKPGDLFVALAGGTTDGHRFIPDVISQGAAAVVGTQSIHGLQVPYLRVENSRLALAHLAAAFYGYPGRKLTVIGVTGTDGKTTTTNLIYGILQAAGIRAGMISTINAVIGDESVDTGFHVTTPDAPDVQRYLAQMVRSGLTHVVLEVTSHGLVQYRADACEFDLAVVTNITHEHLDYHGSFEEYRAAKARLFSFLQTTVPKTQGNPRMAILNRDDSSFDYLSGQSGGETLSYGFHPLADIRAGQVRQSREGLSFVVHGKGRESPIKSPLLGDFNVSNILAAIAATAFTLEVSLGDAQKGIAMLKTVPGRMEQVDLGQEFAAFVDFAHTPNALRKSLETARQLTSGRVIAVFGAAGLRDRQKRAMMAATSLELADLTVLTAEDPRTESLEAILSEMAEGAISQGGIEGQTFWRIPDRGEAIRYAVSLACPGDLVIACGKGHEQSMCFGDVEYPWDDRTAMRAALSDKLAVQGPQMPYLPTQGS